MVMQKRYMKAVPLSGRSPEALVKGWSQALGAVLSELNSDLEKVKS